MKMLYRVVERLGMDMAEPNDCTACSSVSFPPPSKSAPRPSLCPSGHTLSEWAYAHPDHHSIPVSAACEQAKYRVTGCPHGAECSGTRLPYSTVRAYRRRGRSDGWMVLHYGSSAVKIGNVNIRQHHPHQLRRARCFKLRDKSSEDWIAHGQHRQRRPTTGVVTVEDAGGPQRSIGRRG